MQSDALKAVYMYMYVYVCAYIFVSTEMAFNLLCFDFPFT